MISKILKIIPQIEPSLGNEEKREILSVMDSGWYTEAEKTRQFEAMFAKFVECKYACAVTSGAAALYIGLKALGIGKGDEVIVPDLTFVASPNSVEMTGAKPVLIDIERRTLNLDFTKLDGLITKRTKAIMPVDLNGRTTDMKKLMEFAKKNNLFLIEDAAQAIGSKYNNKHVGNISDIACFSFSTPKIVTTGQGGMIITNNKKIFQRCWEIKDFGRRLGTKTAKIFDHNTIGYNFKFTEFQAAVGIGQMRKLKERIKKKKMIFLRYVEMLSDIKNIEFVDTNLKDETIWSADILLKSSTQRTKLINFLRKKNIESRIFFPSIHRLRPYKQPDSRFMVSSNISERGLFLPSSTTLTQKQLNFIGKEINRFFIRT